MGLPPFVKSDGFVSSGFIEDKKREQIDSSSVGYNSKPQMAKPLRQNGVQRGDRPEE